MRIFTRRPYICGETEHGGFPGWLLENGTDSIRLRSPDPLYLAGEYCRGEADRSTIGTDL